MSAFEELGVAPELIRAVEDLGWTLPTPIQAEAIPLILGGGDVMAAAETGSGKTGAFSLPLLQIVHEALSIKSMRTMGSVSSSQSHSTKKCQLNVDDRDDVFAISGDGVTCQARSEHAWGGCRATLGAFSGKVYYEATVRDEGLCRVGWSLCNASLDVGTDKGSFGYGGTGKKSHAKQFEDYGESFGLHDTIGCYLDCETGEIQYSKNGTLLGVAFTMGQAFRGQPLFPAVSLKNAELIFNFGEDSGQSIKYHNVLPGYLPLAQAPESQTATWAQVMASNVGSGNTANRRPLAIILEPARDLAEQTYNNIVDFARYLQDPAVRAELFVGGVSSSHQQRSLKEGVDIVVGTSGRIIDLLEKGDLAVDQVKFFVLDEADRLLDTGNRDSILKLFRKLPKSGAGAARLQVLMFSATLHSPEIRALAAQICENPIVVDLKGKDAVPETVDHVVIHVDPQEDRTWLQTEPVVDTDGIHSVDPPLEPSSTTQEAWSEAVKRLKPRLLVRLLDTLNAEQALVFCRTNLDCDNLEKFLNKISGDPTAPPKRKRPGSAGPQSAYSCMVLAGARSMDERRAALSAFKDGEVRILISTDVAARGIDIQGLPLVVNMTLPDKSEDYVHRVGRVGRADAIGLAVSLVSTVPEKVWYCTVKGLKPWLNPDKKNTKTNDKGGHTIWFDEPALLKQVESRLGGQPIRALPPDLSLPPEIAQRTSGEGLKYGQNKLGGEVAAFAKEVAQRTAEFQPAVEQLAALEHQAQWSFFNLKRKWSTLSSSIATPMNM